MNKGIRCTLAIGFFTAALLTAQLCYSQETVNKSEMQGHNPQKSEPAKSTVEKNAADQSFSEGFTPDWLQVTTKPAQLRASSSSITLHQDGDSRMIYQAIGKQAGVAVLFDPDYVSRTIRVDVNKVSLTDALEIVAIESGTFWRAVNNETIFVAADNRTKRREFEQSIYEIFYLNNVLQATDVQDVVNALRTILEIQRVQQIPSLGAILVRGTPGQLMLSHKIIDDIEKGRRKFRDEYRLDFRINELEDDKRLNSRSYTLLIEPHEAGKLRIGTRVPVMTEDGKQTTYVDVGQNIDCQVRIEGEHMVGLNVDIDFSNFSMIGQLRNAVSPANGNPALQQFRITTKPDLEIGKPTVINSFDDPSSKRTFQIEVTASRIRGKE